MQGGDGLAYDPLVSAARADEAKHTFLFKHCDTVFDRFAGIPPPGGLRMMRKIIENYEVRWPTKGKSRANRLLVKFGVPSGPSAARQLRGPLFFRSFWSKLGSVGVFVR